MPLSKKRMRERKRQDRLGLTLNSTPQEIKPVKPKEVDKPKFDADGYPLIDYYT